MDFCKFVNVFHGCGEIELPEPKGIAARWFFIKAGCGNTSPAASLPFSRLTAGPYSGGYPTGYGDHMPNYHSRPPHFPEGKGLLGFSHLHQSGTGAIGYYYNYAVVTPRYADSPLRVIPTNEKAQPGYYSANLNGIKCELTVTKRLALHRYTFDKDEGEILIDFNNNGLNLPGQSRKTVSGLKVNLYEESIVTAGAEIEGVKIYFAVKAVGGTFSLDENNRAVLRPKKRERIAQLRVALTVKGHEKALEDLKTPAEFDSAKQAALDEWNRYLSRIEIKAYDDKIYEIFYSNLYHSMVKPANWHGESFIYGGDGPFMLDFNTLWDMYKTALPLIFLICKKEGENIAETLLKVGEHLGYLPNSFGLNAQYDVSRSQARMLGAYVLLTAYRFGLEVDPKRMLKVIITDLLTDDKEDFTLFGRCKSHTWLLDMSDACAYAAKVAREIGEDETARLLEPHAEKWTRVYDKNTGLLDENSSFYEGTLYNYSFRQTADMEARIALAGGEERFVKLLDDFFGFGKPAVKQPTDPYNYKSVEEGMKLGRFEGFNNESDMEAPFSYIFANRHDRTCEVIRGGMKYMFTKGRGGIPGNNDTGGLSSYYVWCALGLFPVAGSDLILIASPFVKSAKIKLSSGKELCIKVNNAGDNNIYVKKALFNGREIKNHRIKACELIQGGEIVFDMSDC